VTQELDKYPWEYEPPLEELLNEFRSKIARASNEGKIMDEHREAAVQRLNCKRDFRRQVITYAAVNFFLVVIWAMSGYGHFWPVWVILGWGIGLARHAWCAYGERPITEKEILREMKRGDAA
jgi:hypothetical protein